jgi:stage IV sporulation protein A
MMDIIENKVKGSVKIRDILSNSTTGTESIGIRTGILDLGKGEVSFDICVEEKIFYNTLNENAGQELNNKLDLLNYIRKLSEVSVEYSRIRSALDSAKSRGYGIVLPDAEELQLENPEVTGKGNRYSLKLKASAPSIHVINAQVDTEVTPFVGSQAECERIMNEMKELFEEDPAKMWEMEIFGKNLNELVMNNLNGKVGRMSEDHQEKIKRTLSRVLNENGRGIVFIII